MTARTITSETDAPFTYEVDVADGIQDERTAKLLAIADAVLLLGRWIHSADATELDVDQATVDDHVSPAVEVATALADVADSDAVKRDVTDLDDDLLAAAREDLAARSRV